jgi:hypothetical protein
MNKTVWGGGGGIKVKKSLLALKYFKSWVVARIIISATRPVASLGFS